MRVSPRFCAFCALLFFTMTASPVWAWKQGTKINLHGSSGYFAASGSARHANYRSEPGILDHEETIIEVKNVPLPPGTLLFISITGDPVGTIKLDSYRGGSLTLTSDFRKVVPPIDYSTVVVVQTANGRMVMR